MPLMICGKCGCIENTHLVKDKPGVDVQYIPTIYNYTSVDLKEKFYPNMWLQDMQGHYDEDIIVDGIVWKAKDEIRMLCSECNTGKWHGEFEKVLATTKEIEVAKFSKYNMTTPYDHEEGCLTASPNNTSGYKVHNSYRTLHHIFRELFNKEYTDNMSDFKDNLFSMVYQVFKEDKMNFIPYHNYQDTDWTNLHDVTNYIADCLVYLEETKSMTFIKIYRAVFNMSPNRNKFSPFNNNSNNNISSLFGVCGSTLNDLLDEMGNKNINYSKPHWKETQSQDEKNTRLLKAEEKRLRKKKKK